MNIPVSNRFASFAPSQEKQAPTPVKEALKSDVNVSKANAKNVPAKKKGDRPPQGKNDRRGRDARENRPRNVVRGRGGRSQVTASGSGRGRTYDRHSGTGRPINEEKRGGQGKANWGSFQDEIDMGVAEIDEEAATQGAVSEANPEEAESKVRTLTLDEYQKQQAEKEAKLELNTNQRKVELDDSFKSEFKLLEKNLEEFGTVQKSKKNKKKKNTKTKETVEVVSLLVPPAPPTVVLVVVVVAVEAAVTVENAENVVIAVIVKIVRVVEVVEAVEVVEIVVKDDAMTESKASPLSVRTPSPLSLKHKLLVT